MNKSFGDGNCRVDQSDFFLLFLISSQDKRDIEVLAEPKGKRLNHGEAASRNTHKKKAPGSWTKPEAVWAKLNFDASYWEDEHRGGWGAVFMNITGRVMLTAWGNIAYFPNAENG